MKSGFQRTAVLKYGSRSYIKSKILVASLSGGLALSGGLILFWLLLAATGQSMTPDETLLEYVFLWDILKLDGSGLLLYIGLLYLSFLSGAFWTLAALAFSTFCMDAFLTVCFPVFCQRFIVQLPDRLQFGNGWGKALNTLSQTNVQHAYGIGITFPRKLTIMFSPLSMYLLGLLFKWLTVATFAQVMFAMNIVFHKRVGLPLVLICAIADLSIELMLSSEFYRLSLVSLSRLNTLGTGYQNVLPTLRYRIITIPFVWGLSTTICYFIAVRANILESF